MDTHFKKVDKIVSPPPVHFVGNGFRVHNFIPSVQGLDMRRMGPFLMLDNNSRYYFSPSQQRRGVDVHPHKGFETVTIAYKGRIAHRDSSGGGGIIGEGEVQWMTAGAGILHEEYHETSFSQAGGDFQMVQLWVNLPAIHKQTPPKYQHISRNQLANVQLPGGAHGLLIAGRYAGIKGPTKTFSPLLLMNITIPHIRRTELFLDEGFNSAILVLEGKVIINGHEAGTDHFVLLERQGQIVSIESLNDSLILVLSGSPLNEPIAAQGPFVMNTRTELMEAFEEFRTGKFGVLNR